jgi:hypothetical protein
MRILWGISHNHLNEENAVLIGIFAAFPLFSHHVLSENVPRKPLCPVGVPRPRCPNEAAVVDAPSTPGEIPKFNGFFLLVLSREWMGNGGCWDDYY